MSTQRGPPGRFSHPIGRFTSKEGRKTCSRKRKNTALSLRRPSSASASPARAIGRPVRVYEDFVLCALHHAMHEVGEDIDEAGIGLELVAGWLSVATMHANGYLQGILGNVKTSSCIARSGRIGAWSSWTK